MKREKQLTLISRVSGVPPFTAYGRLSRSVMEQLEQIESLRVEDLLAGDETNGSYSSTSVSKSYASTPAALILISTTFVTGILYVLVQWFRQGAIQDALFVSMLIGATMMLVFGVIRVNKYIVNRSLNFFVFSAPAERPEVAYQKYEKLCRSVMNVQRMTIAGVLYGLVVGSAPFVLNVWDTDILLKILLAVYMFFVNYVTGVAFYGLITFFIQSIKMGKMMKVNLWQINNPSSDFLLGATRRISVMASIYVCVCLSSILFSLLPITGLVIAYSCFSGLTILASLVIPPLPIGNCLGRQHFG